MSRLPAMRVLARAACAACAATLAAGCTSILRSEQPAPTFYVWRDSGQAAPAPRVSPHTLLIAPTATTTFYDSQRIAFSRQTGTRGQYQFAAWTERPGRRLDQLLLERLERRKAFAQVAATTAGVRGDLLLAVTLLDLYHDDIDPPGVARVTVTAELTDRRNRTLVTRQTFAAATPVAADNAEAAVAALDGALARVLDQLVAWLESEAARTSSP